MFWYQYKQMQLHITMVMYILNLEKVKNTRQNARQFTIQVWWNLLAGLVTIIYIVVQLVPKKSIEKWPQLFTTVIFILMCMKVTNGMIIGTVSFQLFVYIHHKKDFSNDSLHYIPYFTVHVMNILTPGMPSVLMQLTI